MCIRSATSPRCCGRFVQPVLLSSGAIVTVNVVGKYSSITADDKDVAEGRDDGKETCGSQASS